MPFAKIIDLKKLLPAHTRVLGIDVGKKTLGLAISDKRLSVATPLETWRRTKLAEDLEKLAELVKEREVGALVLGLPLNMDGTEGPMCQSVRAFGRSSEQMLRLPVYFWDERLSTKAMERHLIAQDVSRAKREKAIDHLAATWILQGALDSLPD